MPKFQKKIKNFDEKNLKSTKKKKNPSELEGEMQNC